MNFVVGTDLAHIVGKSIVAARTHRVLGNIDLKLAGIMVIGTIAGSETGVQAIELLKKGADVDLVVGSVSVIVFTAGYGTICSGGGPYIDNAVRFTSEIAKDLSAIITLLTVVSEPPAMHATLFRRQEDLDALLNSDSELARDLWRNYVIGNVTREIVNRTDRPVLVIRSDKQPVSLADRLRSMATKLAGKRGHTRRMSEA